MKRITINGLLFEINYRLKYILVMPENGGKIHYYKCCLSTAINAEISKGRL